MPSFTSGLISALAKGAEGYQTGANDARDKAAIKLAAQQAVDYKKSQDLLLLRGKFGYIPEHDETVTDTPDLPIPSGYGPSGQPNEGIAPTEPDSMVPTVAPATAAPKTRVVHVPDRFDPAQSEAGVLTGMRNTGALQRTEKVIEGRAAEGTANRESREGEGAANRDSRESEGGANRASRERVAANRAGAVQVAGTEIRSRPVTGTARIGHIISLSKVYVKPVTDGGLGLDAKAAEREAQRDVDALIAHGRAGGVPVPGVPAPAAAAAPPRGDQPPPPPPEATNAGVEEAVRKLKAKHGTMAQLDASDASPEFKAAVKKRLGVKSP